MEKMFAKDLIDKGLIFKNTNSSVSKRQTLQSHNWQKT